MEQQKKAVKKTTRKPRAKSNLIKMVRQSDGKKADVHPEMIDEYMAGGFVKE